MFSIGEVLREGLRKQEGRTRIRTCSCLRGEPVGIFVVFPLLASIYCSIFHLLCGSWTLLDSLVVKSCYYYAFFPFAFDFHQRVSLDVALVVPLIMDLIEFYMKWVSI